MILPLNFEIRPYRATDYTPLLAVINALCAEGGWMYTKQFQLTSAWRHALESPDCSCHLLLVVVNQQQELLGWCDLFPEDIASEATLGIGLLAPYRNKGIGQKVLRQALTWTQQQPNWYKVNLIVKADNMRAIHLYKKFGFQTTGTIDPPIPANGEWQAMALQWFEAHSIQTEKPVVAT